MQNISESAKRYRILRDDMVHSDTGDGRADDDFERGQKLHSGRQIAAAALPFRPVRIEIHPFSSPQSDLPKMESHLVGLGYYESSQIPEEKCMCMFSTFSSRYKRTEYSICSDVSNVQSFTRKRLFRSVAISERRREKGGKIQEKIE